MPAEAGFCINALNMNFPVGCTYLSKTCALNDTFVSCMSLSYFIFNHAKLVQVIFQLY